MQKSKQWTATTCQAMSQDTDPGTHPYDHGIKRELVYKSTTQWICGIQSTSNVHDSQITPRNVTFPH